MRPEQWETFKRAVRREKMDKVPMALIVDSPWIPGYLGIKVRPRPPSKSREEHAKIWGVRSKDELVTNW